MLLGQQTKPLDTTPPLRFNIMISLSPSLPPRVIQMSCFQSQLSPNSKQWGFPGLPARLYGETAEHRKGELPLKRLGAWQGMRDNDPAGIACSGSPDLLIGAAEINAVRAPGLRTD
jgi:hypothetical protein